MTNPWKKLIAIWDLGWPQDSEFWAIQANVWGMREGWSWDQHSFEKDPVFSSQHGAGHHPLWLPGPSSDQ